MPFDNNSKKKDNSSIVLANFRARLEVVAFRVMSKQ